MPIYEYLCRGCDSRFERLRPMGASSNGVSCPQCGAEHVEKQFSTFSGSSADSSDSGLPSLGGGCGSSGFT